MKALALLLLFIITPSYADNLNVAVASNFSHTLHSLADDFESKTSHRIRIISASTGKIYNQIKHGAPFDIFFAADELRPNRLIAEGDGKAVWSMVYAIGKLVLISNIKPKNNCSDILGSTALKRLAIANPKTAPYGLAAKQTLEKLQLWNTLKPKLVTGENIAQSFQFVATGNASAGFISKSLLLRASEIKLACQWPVPSDMHDPIKQKMLVLNIALNKAAAIAFWQYMQTDDAKKIIKNNSYDLPLTIKPTR